MAQRWRQPAEGVPRTRKLAPCAARRSMTAQDELERLAVFVPRVPLRDTKAARRRHALEPRAREIRDVRRYMQIRIVVPAFAAGRCAPACRPIGCRDEKLAAWP